MLQLQAREEAKLLSLLLSLTEILDSFDQLTKVAMICDLLYPPEEQVHKQLFALVEDTARLLRGLPPMHHQGLTNVPACAVEHCPCPFPCDRDAL